MASNRNKNRRHEHEHENKHKHKHKYEHETAQQETATEGTTDADGPTEADAEVTEKSAQRETVKLHLLFIWDANGPKLLGPFYSFDEALAQVPEDVHHAVIGNIRCEVVK